MKKILALVLAAVMALALVACGAAPAETPAAAPAEAPAAAPAEAPAAAPADSGKPFEGHTLYVANWQDYMSDADYVEKAFEEKYGCEVEHVYYNSYEELMTTLQTGGNKTIDACVLSHNYTQWFHEAGLLKNVDPADIPNYAFVDPLYKDLAPYAVDADGNVFAFPWLNGTSALFYNPELCPIEINHWSDLLKPEVKGHVMFLSGANDCWIVGCLLSGQDPDHIEDVDIDLVRESLMQLKENMLGFWSSNDEQLMPWYSGDFYAGELWSGPYCELLAKDPGTVKMVHPEEGTIAYVDYWSVVEGTDEYELACLWIDFIESEEVQTTMGTGISETYPGEYYTYPPVNANALKALTPEQLIPLQLDPAPTCLKMLPYIADPDLKEQWDILTEDFTG